MREQIVGMQKFLKIAHQIGHMIVVGRDEDCILQADSDPVLTLAELTRLLALAAYAGHQDSVGLAQQPVGQGQFFQCINRVIDGFDVVLYLFPIVAVLRGQIIGVLERILDIGPYSFNAAGLGSLLGHMHADEEFDIGYQLGTGVQLTKCPIGTTKQFCQLRIGDHPFVADSFGQKGLVSVSVFGPPRFEIRNVHTSNTGLLLQICLSLMHFESISQPLSQKLPVF